MSGQCSFRPPRLPGMESTASAVPADHKAGLAGLAGLARAIDRWFFPVLLASAVLLAAIVHPRMHPMHPMLYALTGLLALAAGVTVLKAVVGRERPDGSTRDSFPSGHAAAAFYAASALSAAALSASGSAVAVAIVVGAHAWAAAVAWSRVVIGRHYASDVVAGGVLGVLAASLALPPK